MSVQRVPIWLPAKKNERVFTWLHSNSEYIKSFAVVLVSPVGPESMHCNRSIRCLADQLAKNNLLVARFDFPGMGDSSGSLENNNIWDEWLSAPQVVSQFLRDSYDVKDIVIISLRSASMLLESYHLKNTTKGVVYWYPYTRGASFVRDMQALDSMLKLKNSECDSVLNAGGYPLNEKSQNNLKSINLHKSFFKNIENALIIQNEKLPVNNKFHDKLSSHGVSVDSIKLDGLTQMARQPALSVIPFDNLNHIESWVCKLIENPREVAQFVAKENTLESRFYTESTVFIDGERNIFGILTLPETSICDKNMTLLLLSNAGVAHHIAPNRFHVDVARVLAKEGIATFRMDLSNLGESVDKFNNELHHPYPPTAAQDINEAVDFLKSKYKFDNIILSGLCSGAHNAFHAALSDSTKIKGLILINPLTFYWSPGQSIFEPEDSKDEIDSVYYQDQMFDLTKWLKLILNPIKILSVANFIFRVIRNKLYVTAKRVFKKTGLAKLDKMENDINNLFKAKIPISIIYSETDPGLNILMSKAGSVVKKGLNEELFFSILIKNADHTFSSRAARKQLVSSIVSSVSLIKNRV